MDFHVLVNHLTGIENGVALTHESLVYVELNACFVWKWHLTRVWWLPELSLGDPFGSWFDHMPSVEWCVALTCSEPIVFILEMKDLKGSFMADSNKRLRYLVLTRKRFPIIRIANLLYSIRLMAIDDYEVDSQGGMVWMSDRRLLVVRWKSKSLNRFPNAERGLTKWCWRRAG